jgi:tetrahydromethanopterin S-methyltransferase subunit F
VSAVRVTMDGQALVDRLDGTPISVDPGEHHFVFDALGFRRMETSVVAQAGNKRTRIVVYLNAFSPPNAAPAPDVGEASAVAPASNPRAAEPSEQALTSRGRNKKIALGLGAAAVAGLAVGSIWAIRSRSTYDHAITSECDGDPGRCSPQGIADGHNAHDQAAVATVGFVAAGVLLSAAAVVYFTVPRPTQLALAPSVADHSGGLAVVGQW